MNKPTYIVITEDQAEQFEQAGIPVQVQYTVSVADITGVASKRTTTPKTSASRSVVGAEAQLRWTNLAWDENTNTNHHVAYQLLAAHFSKKDPPVDTRRKLSRYLNVEMEKRNITFYSAIISFMIRKRYLEVA